MITARVFPLLFFFAGAFGIQNHLPVLKVAGLLTAYRCLVTQEEDVRNTACRLLQAHNFSVGRHVASDGSL
jgi:hypothetical protein